MKTSPTQPKPIKITHTNLYVFDKIVSYIGTMDAIHYPVSPSERSHVKRLADAGYLVNVNGRLSIGETGKARAAVKRS
jgi:hypothetical protein